MSIVNEDLEEIKLLSKTLGIKVLNTVIHNLKSIHPSTFISKAKALELINKSKILKCNNIIINDEISPAQMKNLQEIAGMDVRILDRTGIIIDIFNIHAQSSEAKKQVQLAKLEYMLPRLTRQWTHLERQMGGTGTRGGPGEKQIEIDRRLIRGNITKLKKDIEKISQSKNTQRKRRDEAICISLAGYTNAGKSTLMNSLTKSNVYAKDELFATLDSTTKELDLQIAQKVLLSDTVGFIQKLPHELVASFQTTLSDIKSSDFILKVIDSSYENISMHIDTIQRTLEELSCSNIESKYIFNKIDLISEDEIKGLFRKYPDSIFISAKKNIGINDLRKYLQKIIKINYVEEVIKIKYDALSIINEIYSNLDVLKREDKELFVSLTVQGEKSKIESIKAKLNKKT